MFSRIILDAAGRLSRFTRMVPSTQYGVQYHRAGEKSSILDFEFFEGGYGGVVSVEGRRRNFCFLVDREHVQRIVCFNNMINAEPIGWTAGGVGW